jgi:hypothetical protein
MKASKWALDFRYLSSTEITEMYNGFLWSQSWIALIFWFISSYWDNLLEVTRVRSQCLDISSFLSTILHSFMVLNRDHAVESISIQAQSVVLTWLVINRSWTFTSIDLYLCMKLAQYARGALFSYDTYDGRILFRRWILIIYKSFSTSSQIIER